MADGQHAEKGGDVPCLFRCPVHDVVRSFGHNERELVDLCVPVLEELSEGGHHGIHGVSEHGTSPSGSTASTQPSLIAVPWSTP